MSEQSPTDAATRAIDENRRLHERIAALEREREEARELVRNLVEFYRGVRSTKILTLAENTVASWEPRDDDLTD